MRRRSPEDVCCGSGRDRSHRQVLSQAKGGKGAESEGRGWDERVTEGERGTASVVGSLDPIYFFSVRSGKGREITAGRIIRGEAVADSSGHSS